MKKIIALVLAMTMLFAVSATMNVFAADEPTFTVNSVSGKPGDTVEVVISVENNPGIIGAQLYISYDSNVLELTAKPTPGDDFSDMSYAKYLTDNPYNMLWDGSLDGNNTANGTYATLVFRIKDTASVGTTALTIWYDEGTVYDEDWTDIEFAVVNGSVTVEEDTVDFEAATEYKGANIRLESTDLPTGLRFATTVSKADLGIEGEYAYAEDADIIFGVFMLPKKHLTSSGYATLQELVESGTSDKVLDVVAKKIYAQDETTITYTAVLTGIPEKDWETVVYAVPYVLKGGKYYFAEQINNSYYSVAKTAREGTYSDASIAAITDPAKKAEAQEIASKLDDIIVVVEDEQGWIQGWY